ncbi:MAG: putative selenate ABC transporter substrate-binding protein [SAR324 cluster bacterium]|nr:putative selenate ABC transporter substrate-binding protein [SAR324 cluster bacterium]MBF0352593.1 putative selenate ABC transporter substrate-binding protein [SAR324 cluster bacterium]
MLFQISLKKICLLLSMIALMSAVSLAQTFKFTAIPDEDTARLQERFNKVAQYLSKELNVKVEYIPVKSYSASIAAFKNNDVQLAWFGGLSGVQARLAVPGSLAIAQGEEDTTFISYIIAHTSTGLSYGEDFPEKIEGKTFSFGSKGSTSGRLMPEYYIRQFFKKSPEDVFSRVGFSGDHSKTLALVQSGSYQVGVLNFKVWENEVKAGNVDATKVQVLWKTPTYPDYNWTIRGDADAVFGKGFIQKTQKALIGMKDRELLDTFPRDRFIEADNTMYQPILDTAQEIGILRE